VIRMMLRECILTAATAAVLLLAGCASVGEQNVAASTAAATADVERHWTCARTVDLFKQKLDALRSNLASYDLDEARFGVEVDVATVFDQGVDETRIGTDRYCMGEVVAPLRSALQGYAVTHRTWHACVIAIGCDMKGDRLAAMRKTWAEAATAIHTADRALGDYPSAQD